jgi:hypothetical protein
MTDRARLRWALDKHLDRVAAARRLAGLVNASGMPNPAHQAAYFRVRWESQRFMDKLVIRWRAREKEKSARHYLRDAYGRSIADD